MIYLLGLKLSWRLTRWSKLAVLGIIDKLIFDEEAAATMSLRRKNHRFISAKFFFGAFCILCRAEYSNQSHALHVS